MTQTTAIDVRSIAPRDRHPTIFATFRGLASGASIELLNDHDPRPLYHQLQAEFPAGFSWDYLETGPATWRVSITKLGDAAPKKSGCCGCCGGGG